MQHKAFYNLLLHNIEFWLLCNKRLLFTS